MRIVAPVLVALCLTGPAQGGQPFAPYADRSEFLLASPGAAGNGLQGYVNPALLSSVEHAETVFAWSDGPGARSPADRWGAFTGLPHLGFGVVHQEIPGKDVREYRISLGAGDRSTSLGLGYGWATGGTGPSGRRNVVVVGGLMRPTPHMSLGLTYTAALSAPGREGALDLAVRPFGDERVTLFAEGAVADRRAGDESCWSTGAALQVFPGARLTARLFDNRTVSLGLHVSLGHVGLQTQSRFDRDRRHTFNTHAIRFGAYERNAGLDRLFPRPRYLEMALLGPVRHRRYVFFDTSRTLVELLALIERARRDPRINGIAINVSGMRISSEMAWELRVRLQQFRSGGKRVVAYIDRADLRTYHFASVADHLLLDPAGMVTLGGFVAGQTYFKGALAKLGIGFEEWRFFEYKSALESLTRNDMSPAEREQLQALIDTFYELARDEICRSRGLDAEEFDRLVDEETVFLPSDALANGLVDEVARWDRVEELLETLEGRKTQLIAPEAYPVARDQNWGEYPRVAVVYALGICDMDQGIGARRLVQEIEAAAQDPQVRAVVLRVDSPGGDILPSDLVAEAVKQCKEKKPVIVSQGSVAASGGYWLSMYGDAIVAAPTTVTGSIGVIGGWLYNQGFKEKLGLSTDHVQAGAHADLGFGARVPLLGLHLPDRNLSPSEKQTMERTVRALYGDFVGKVAEGRGKTWAEVDSVAQGRVWSGRDALNLGLVDRLGGLATAVELARERAGIDADTRVRLVEFPRRNLFHPDTFRPRLLGLAERDQAVLEHLEFRLEHNGRPLPLLPAGDLGRFYLEGHESTYWK